MSNKIQEKMQEKMLKMFEFILMASFIELSQEDKQQIERIRGEIETTQQAMDKIEKESGKKLDDILNDKNSPYYKDAKSVATTIIDFVEHLENMLNHYTQEEEEQQENKKENSKNNNVKKVQNFYPEQSEKYAIYIHDNNTTSVEAVQIFLDVVCALDKKSIYAVIEEVQKNGKAWIMQGNEDELEDLKFELKVFENIIKKHADQERNFGPLKFTIEELPAPEKKKSQKKKL